MGIGKLILSLLACQKIMQTNSSIKESERKPSGLWTKYRADGSPYGVMVVGDFPIDKFAEWIGICKKEFSSVRWAKIWSDHEKEKMLDLIVQGKFDMKTEQKEEKKVPLTLSG